MDKFTQLLTLIGFILYWLLVAGVTLRVVIKRRSVGVSFSWLLVIYFLPFVGVLVYLLVGELHLGKNRAARAKAMFTPYRKWFAKLYQHSAHQPKSQSYYGLSISQLCNTQLAIPSLTNNKLALLATPKQIMDALIDDINQAQTNINMEFYIWHPGGQADDVAIALMSAAKRGVTINILLDAAGSWQFFKSPWPQRMQDAGITVVPALIVSPMRMLFRRVDLRIHRKIVVFDNHIAYTGSMNLVDPKYFKQKNNVGQWIDIMLRITGPVVPVINTVNAWDWEVETNQRILPELPKETDLSDGSLVQVIPSGPGMPPEVIHKVLLQSLYEAKRKIVITTPYFVPSENLLDALTTAAQRGVDVNLIVPKKNDSMMVKWASRAFFGDLLESGVKIHSFNGGLLHTKSIVIDDEHCLVGSVNLDMRSLWLNFELTLAIDDPQFSRTMAQLQTNYMAQSEQLELTHWQDRPMYHRFIEQFFYLFSPLL